jgi:CRISPR-associated protein Cst2
LKPLTHVAGTFLIHADASFLNGAGLGEGENRNVTVPKTLKDQKDDVPYVSSQAWKRWLRNTLIEETGWEASELVSIKSSEKGSTSKIAGQLDPVMYAEDDLFGYMRAQEGQGKAAKKESVEGDETEADELEDSDTAKTPKTPKTKALVRASPFSASLLVSIRKKGWKGVDEGFVHLKEGTPLPYTTEFYTTHLQGVFCLAHYRVGLFQNVGDRIELEEVKAKKYMAEGKVKTREGGYELSDTSEAGKRSGALLKALAVLRGGAKQAAFGTDVAPKFLVLAGLSCGNPIFNHLFADEASTGLVFKVDRFKEVLSDYADRIKTPVQIGIRAGYVNNESEIKELTGSHKFERGVVEVVAGTPRDAAEAMANLL